MQRKNTLAAVVLCCIFNPVWIHAQDSIRTGVSDPAGTSSGFNSDNDSLARTDTADAAERGGNQTGILATAGSWPRLL